MTISFMNALQCYIHVYDITNKKGFEHPFHWIDLIKHHGIDDVQLFGLPPKVISIAKRKVTAAQGQHFVDEIGLHFYEVSAKDDVNVDEAFTDIARATLRFKINIDAHQVTNDGHLQLNSENTTQILLLSPPNLFIASFRVCIRKFAFSFTGFQISSSLLK